MWWNKNLLYGEKGKGDLIIPRMSDFYLYQWALLLEPA